MNEEVVKSNLIVEMEKALKNEVIQRHSYFQLKYFLIGKEPTLQSKMWQCLRELKTRHESLKNIELELEETKDKIELLDINAKRIQIELEKTTFSDNNFQDLFARECGVKTRQSARQKEALIDSTKQLEERRRYLLEECRFFLETFKNIEKMECLRNFDDIESQKEYWHEKLTQKINLKMLTNSSIDTDLIETIVALPDEVPIKKQTLQNLNMRQNEMLQKLNQVAKKIEEKNREN
jgi:hypothetical protein